MAVGTQYQPAWSAVHLISEEAAGKLCCFRPFLVPCARVCPGTGIERAFYLLDL